METKKSFFILSAVSGVLFASSAIAQTKVPGEKWRHTVSMETEGFSMPARTTEFCAPIGKVETAVAQQQPNCSISNMKQNGNKSSFDIACTGKDAMTGHFESERVGDTMKGMMTGSAGGTSMKMKFESTKLPGACQADDYSNYKPPVVAAVAPVDMCQTIADQSGKSDNLASVGTALLSQYPTPDGKGMADCTKHAAFKQFCSRVQTPAGFAQLEHQEWGARAVKADAGETPSAKMMRAPLSASMQACGLGTGPAAVTTFQKKMVVAAKENRSYGFLLYYAAGDEYAAMVETAKKQCSGRSFTNATDATYASLCRNYGSALVRGDRAGAMEAAGCSQEREDAAKGICVGATSSGSGAVANVSGSQGGASGTGAGASGSAGAAAAAAPGSAEAAAEEAKAQAEKDGGNKTKDAINKGKKALKGLFGG